MSRDKRVDGSIPFGSTNSINNLRLNERLSGRSFLFFDSNSDSNPA
jgi:hypothetical protein